MSVTAGGEVVAQPVLLGLTAATSWSVTSEVVDLTRKPPTSKTVTVDALPQRIGLDLTRCALVVVDMQNEFCSPGGWVAHRGVDLRGTRAPIASLARLLRVLRGAEVPVVWLNWGNREDKANLPPSVLHTVNPDGRSLGIGDQIPGRPDARVLQRGSWSTEVVPELEVAQGDLHVAKYRVSGFWDTELDTVLRNLGATTLLFAGVNTDQCVLATLTDAACIGYDCVMLEDCVGTTSPAFCSEATFYNVRGSLGFVVSGRDLIKGIHVAGIAPQEGV